MDLSLLPVLAAAVTTTAAGTATLLRNRRERVAVDVTRPLPARPPAGGREYRDRRPR